MLELLDKWDTLKKALNHKKAVASATVSPPKPDVPTEAHPDHLNKVEYGHSRVGGEDGNIGYLKTAGKGFAVRHGAAAQRTDVEHQMAKLLGADHMVPEQSYDHGLNHPVHHNERSFNPHYHGGTSIQEHHDGEELPEALEDEGLTKKVRDHWKNGDLHKLWALHYISNNADMHCGNFKVGKDGIKAFDSDHAFYELPTGHMATHYADGNHPEYNEYAQHQLPSYLNPFVERSNDDGIEPTYSKDQVAVKALNEHAKNINPDLFEKFGPHAAERAAKAKKALMSADPTGEMIKLWDDHSDKTGDLTWEKNEKKAAKKAAAKGKKQAA